MRWLVALLFLGIALAGCLDDSDEPLDELPEASSYSDALWSLFEADRKGLVQDLSPPFVECFQRRDSAIDPASPVFHGCLDWHSAVHAAYAHHAAYHVTQDGGYLDLVDQKFAPLGVSLLPAEHVYQQAKGQDLPLTENPYGFGWFLVLARERELTTGETDLREMADYAADMMVSWYEERLEEGDAWDYIRNNAHPNYSWSLINLDVWAKYTGDASLQASVQEFSMPLFGDVECPVQEDTNVSSSGFQPTCLMRLAALAHIWGDHVSDWIQGHLPEGYWVPPISEPVNCHAGGLNFTRAFALKQLYWLTNETHLRDNHVELVRHHVAHSELYTGSDYLGEPDYLCYGHWVAQVGVRAISLSYEERPLTPEEPPAVLSGQGLALLPVDLPGSLEGDGLVGTDA